MADGMMEEWSSTPCSGSVAAAAKNGGDHGLNDEENLENGVQNNRHTSSSSSSSEDTACDMLPSLRLTTASATKEELMMGDDDVLNQPPPPYMLCYPPPGASPYHEDDDGHELKLKNSTDQSEASEDDDNGDEESSVEDSDEEEEEDDEEVDDDNEDEISAAHHGALNSFMSFNGTARFPLQPATNHPFNHQYAPPPSYLQPPPSYRMPYPMMMGLPPPYSQPNAPTSVVGESDNASRSEHALRAKRSCSFPEKLHKMLETIEAEGLMDVVSFSSHGRAFAIHKPRRFCAEVMPRFFRQTKLASFQRQLNLYGFRRIYDGPDNGGYYHKYFLRGQPSLARDVKRRVKQKKSLSSPGSKANAEKSPSSDPEPKYVSSSSVLWYGRLCRSLALQVHLSFSLLLAFTHFLLYHRIIIIRLAYHHECCLVREHPVVGRHSCFHRLLPFTEEEGTIHHRRRLHHPTAFVSVRYVLWNRLAPA